MTDNRPRRKNAGKKMKELLSQEDVEDGDEEVEITQDNKTNSPNNNNNDNDDSNSSNILDDFIAFKEHVTTTMGLITHNLQQLNNNTKTELYLLKNQLGEIKKS